MLEFQTIDSFVVTGRGTGHVVTNQTEKPEADLIAELIGTTVLLDGVPRKVLGVESWLVPRYVVKAGETIVILVNP